MSSMFHVIALVCGFTDVGCVLTVTERDNSFTTIEACAFKAGALSETMPNTMLTTQKLLIFCDTTEETARLVNHAHSKGYPVHTFSGYRVIPND